MLEFEPLCLILLILIILLVTILNRFSLNGIVLNCIDLKVKKIIETLVLKFKI